MFRDLEKPRPKILIVHPRFSVTGGAEIVAFQVIDYCLNTLGAEVQLLTLEPVDFERMERESGLRLADRPFAIVLAPCPRWVVRRRGSGFLLGLAFLHRRARKMARDFTLCVSTVSEIDFGIKGFQLVHHPVFADRALLHRYNFIGTWSILDRMPVLNRVYRRLVALVAHSSVEGYRRNVTVGNSRFISDVLCEAYGIRAPVLYPGTLSGTDQSEQVPWQERAFRFVSVGRFAPDKNIVELVHVYAGLHAAFPQAQFVIAGRSADPEYFRLVERAIEEKRVPVRLEKDLDSGSLNALVGSSMYHVTAKAFEHFGLANLEAANAGCIPFIPDSGGQREVITPAVLHYSSIQDLVDKVRTVQGDAALRQQLLSKLMEDVRRFTKAHFIADLDEHLKPLVQRRLVE